MKTPTLVSNRLYFGLDPLRLRDSIARVLARVAGVPHDKATVGLEAITQDFRLGSAASRAMIEEMVKKGVLERLSPTGIDFGITDKFRVLAAARVVQPLSRREAKVFVAGIPNLATAFNRTAVANKYEIAAVAVYGSYMSLDDDLADVSIGVTGRRRPPPATKPSAHRLPPSSEGTDQIRALFEQQTPYARVAFFQQLKEMPRPFAVVFKDESER